MLKPSPHKISLPECHCQRPHCRRSWSSPRLMLFALALFLLAGVAQAQITDPSVFSYIPDPPEADRPFTLVIRVSPCLHGTYLLNQGPLDRDIAVSTGRIEVTVLYGPIMICTPTALPHDNPIQIDSVAAGTYELVVIGRDAAHPDDPAFNSPRYQTSVTVVEQSLAISRPVSVPSVTAPVLALLAGLMLLVGSLVFRRQA